MSTGSKNIASTFAAALLVFTLPTAHAAESKPSRSWGDGALLRITVGDARAGIALDELSSVRKLSANALFTIGSSNGEHLTEYVAASSDNPRGQRTELNIGSVPIGHLVNLEVTHAEASASMNGESVSNVVVSVSEAAVAAAGTARGIDYHANATASKDSAIMTRDIELHQFELLRIRDLLDWLGLDLLEYTCTDVGSVAALMGVEVGDVCAQLAGADDAVADAVTFLESVRADALALRDNTLNDIDAADTARAVSATAVTNLQTQRDALTAQTSGQSQSAAQTTVSTLTPLCPTLFGAAKTQCESDLAAAQGIVAAFNSLSSTEAALTAEQATLAALEASIDALEATLAQVNALLDQLDALLATGGTCDAVAEALASAATLVPASADGANAAAQAAADACALLLGTLDELLDTPLITLGRMGMQLRAESRKGETVTKSIGYLSEITIANLPPVGITLESTRAAREQVAETATEQIVDILAALDIDAAGLKVDMLQFLTDSTIAEDGSTSATAEGYVLTMHIPSLTVDTGTSAPFAVLGDGGPVSLNAGTVTTPPLTLDVARYSAASGFSVTELGGGGGVTSGSSDRLPVTGVTDTIFAGAAMLLLASLVRRWMRQVPA